MHVVVAGGTGLIGRRLVAALLSRGDRVVVLTRSAESRLPPGAERVLWDGQSRGNWWSALAGADAVFNLAGEPIFTRWTERNKRVLLDSRIDPTRALVAALRPLKESRPRVLLNASAVGFYGPHPFAEPLDEAAKTGSGFLAELAFAWEAEAEEARPLGMRVVRLRTGVVLDPAGGALAQMLPAFRAYLGGPVGDGTQAFPWIHAQDQLRLMLWALDGGADGPLNLVAPEACTMGQFAKALGQALDRPARVRVPAGALRLLLGEASEAVLTGQRAVPQKAVQLGFQFRFPQLDQALGDLVGRAKVKG